MGKMGCDMRVVKWGRDSPAERRRRLFQLLLLAVEGGRVESGCGGGGWIGGWLCGTLRNTICATLPATLRATLRATLHATLRATPHIDELHRQQVLAPPHQLEHPGEIARLSLRGEEFGCSLCSSMHPCGLRLRGARREARRLVRGVVLARVSTGLGDSKELLERELSKRAEVGLGGNGTLLEDCLARSTQLAHALRRRLEGIQGRHRRACALKTAMCFSANIMRT